MTIIAPPPVCRGSDGSAGDQGEALFKEARQRRRRRRMWAIGGIALALIVAGFGVALAGGAPAGTPPTTAGHHSGRPSVASSGPRHGDGASPPTSSYVSAFAIGQAGRDVSWMANGYGVYVTSDTGRTWRTVTPPTIQHQLPGEHIGAMVGIGQSDLWLPIEDVIGLVPFSQSTDGSDRGEGIEWSTDGGQTWSFTALPGCLQACGVTSLSFVNAEDGFAIAGPGSGATTRLFATTDGGATWKLVSNPPFVGDEDEVEASLAFTTQADGWAISGPRIGTYQQNGGRVITPGAVLYRTTDGGLTWSVAKGLPKTGRYQLPTFFGPRDGVVLGQPGEGSGKPPSVYVTRDGGAHWVAARLPAGKGIVAYHLSNAGPPTVPFDAVSPTVWKLYVGPSLYTTTDAGRTWTRSAAKPPAAAGTISTIAFSSVRDGLARMLPPGCPVPSRDGAESNACYSILASTTDGGRTWRPLTP